MFRFTIRELILLVLVVVMGIALVAALLSRTAEDTAQKIRISDLRARLLMAEGRLEAAEEKLAELGYPVPREPD